MRNVAFNNTVAKYVYLSDVDFIPILGLHDNLKYRISQGLLDNRTVCQQIPLYIEMSVYILVHLY